MNSRRTVLSLPPLNIFSEELTDPSDDHSQWNEEAVSNSWWCINELSRARKTHPKRATTVWMKIRLPYEKRRSYNQLRLATARKRPGISFQFCFSFSVLVSNHVNCASIIMHILSYSYPVIFPADLTQVKKNIISLPSPYHVVFSVQT